MTNRRFSPKESRSSMAMALHKPTFLPGLFFLPFVLLISGFIIANSSQGFEIEEGTISDIQTAFKENKLTSRKLVEFYLKQIQNLNPIVHGVIEVNPDALSQADKADQERRYGILGSFSMLHGIPILVKDSIATKDKLNTTAGSFALLGSIVPCDAGVVKRLRRAGAVILGKASLNEWSGLRSAISGWSARGGLGKNPYVLSGDPCGSSSGSAISVAANMVTVSLGSETDGSIICPSSYNSVVGIKPTVGLTSRAGLIPISPRQDTVGPITRTVSDAVYVLDSIVGIDHRDFEATIEAARFIPVDGYKRFLKAGGLKEKRLGIVRDPFFNSLNGSDMTQAFQDHLNTLRESGAVLIDNLEIENIDVILNLNVSGEATAVLAEFKLPLNAYLKELVASPVRSLADVTAFNQKFSNLEMLDKYGQEILVAAEATNGIGDAEKEALLNMERLSKQGFEKLMREHELDALVTPDSEIAPLLAIGGYPGISVPAGYRTDGMPFGICFGGLKGSEPKLIEIAYGFEQATKIRKPPSFLP
ncbi:hypothetical protein F0562_036112 [Nyssa sinensis]|uniref:Amidase domain-containing protein n=1 Tax=Nyssa sinensis TaxID=561372 RepID=A0A5J5AH18_9ASTE|nr:hypothetical protein F0562_036112 [Nyssa sinensis]